MKVENGGECLSVWGKASEGCRRGKERQRAPERLQSRRGPPITCSEGGEKMNKKARGDNQGSETVKGSPLGPSLQQYQNEGLHTVKLASTGKLPAEKEVFQKGLLGELHEDRSLLRNVWTNKVRQDPKNGEVDRKKKEQGEEGPTSGWRGYLQTEGSSKVKENPPLDCRSKKKKGNKADSRKEKKVKRGGKRSGEVTRRRASKGGKSNHTLNQG